VERAEKPMIEAPVSKAMHILSFTSKIQRSYSI